MFESKRFPPADTALSLELFDVLMKLELKLPELLKSGSLKHLLWELDTVGL